MVEARGKQPIPAIFFQGVGAGGDNYVAPVMADPNSLTDKVRNVGTADAISGVAVSEPEQFAGKSELTALAFGLLSGAGKDMNTARIINALRALKEEGALPETLFLSGHSRGAINCISLANAIYKEFGSEIKLDLCLTDPVPGPGKSSAADERIIPPNVRTFTCFYAERGGAEDGLLDKALRANDLSKLKFANPNTAVTSYSVPGTTHNTVLHDYRVTYAITQITHAANGIPFNQTFNEYATNAQKQLQDLYFAAQRWDLNAPDPATFTPLDPSQMLGSGARVNAAYHRTTPILSDIPPQLSAAVNNVRVQCEQNYVPQPSKALPAGAKFDENDIPDAKARTKFLHALFKENKDNKTSRQDSLESHGRVVQCAIKILSEVKPVKPHDGKKWVKINYGTANGENKTGYVSPESKKVLDIAKKAQKESAGNKYSVEWSKADRKINNMGFYENIARQNEAPANNAAPNASTISRLITRLPNVNAKSNFKSIKSDIKNFLNLESVNDKLEMAGDLLNKKDYARAQTVITAALKMLTSNGPSSDRALQSKIEMQLCHVSALQGDLEMAKYKNTGNLQSLDLAQKSYEAARDKYKSSAELSSGLGSEQNKVRIAIENKLQGVRDESQKMASAAEPMQPKPITGGGR